MTGLMSTYMLGVLETGKTELVFSYTELCWIEAVVILFVRARCFGQTGWSTVHVMTQRENA